MDESLIKDWENEDFPMPDDDEIDSAIASSLQAQYDAQILKNTKDDSFLQSLDEDLDYAIALSLQTEYAEKPKENADVPQKSSVGDKALLKSSQPLSIVDKQWELLDPHPDIHALFQEYDARFFYGNLQGVVVSWSPRMKLCAGVCCYEGRGGLCSIRLSMPLLKFRPRRDLVETLLHEMIHAFLFVTHNNKDREGHGPEFLKHMNRINKETGTRISVYHSFHDEVDLYRIHFWKCDGPCRNRSPFYGIVKRAINRAPGPHDNWWTCHQTTCGGKFIKIKEPENFNIKGQKRKTDDDKIKASTSSIKSFFGDSTSKCLCNGNSSSAPSVSETITISLSTSVLTKESNVVMVKPKEKIQRKHFVPFHGNGQKLGESVKNSLLSSSVHSEKRLSSSSVSDENPVFNPKMQKVGDLRNIASTSSNPDAKLKVLVQSPIEKFFSLNKENKQNAFDGKSCVARIPLIDVESGGNVKIFVSCPICTVVLKNYEINSHLDRCLQK